MRILGKLKKSLSILKIQCASADKIQDFCLDNKGRLIYMTNEIFDGDIIFANFRFGIKKVKTAGATNVIFRERFLTHKDGINKDIEDAYRVCIFQ